MSSVYEKEEEEGKEEKQATAATITRYK